MESSISPSFRRKSHLVVKKRVLLLLPLFLLAAFLFITSKVKADCSVSGCYDPVGFHECLSESTPRYLCERFFSTYEYLEPSTSDPIGPCTCGGGSSPPCIWFWHQIWGLECEGCCWTGSGSTVVFSGLVLDPSNNIWTTNCSGPPTCPVPHPDPPCNGLKGNNLYLDCRDDNTCSHPEWTCFPDTGGFFQGRGSYNTIIGVDLVGLPAPYNNCDWWVVWDQQPGKPETGEHGEGCTAWFNPGTSDREKGLRFRMKTACPCGTCFEPTCSCASEVAVSPAKEFARKTGEKAFVSLVDNRKSVYAFSPERLTASFTFNLEKVFQKIFGFFNLLSSRKQ